MSWRVGESNPGGGNILRTRPNRPWGTPSLLHNGHRVSIPGAKGLGRGVNQSLYSIERRTRRTSWWPPFFGHIPLGCGQSLSVDCREDWTVWRHISGTFSVKIGIPANSNVGRDSPVGIATRYVLEGPGIESRWWQDFSYLSTPSLKPLIHAVTGLFHAGKAAGA